MNHVGKPIARNPFFLTATGQGGRRAFALRLDDHRIDRTAVFDSYAEFLMFYNADVGMSAGREEFRSGAVDERLLQ
ncbi:hypothetical protein TNCV_3734241 [Trichonephila clavipes]|nr:hypothetical protein TNCV_3734241 [Trichonephila clavipes]